MKNYMANKSFSRGFETLGAEASMVFVRAISRTFSTRASMNRPAPAVYPGYPRRLPWGRRKLCLCRRRFFSCLPVGNTKHNVPYMLKHTDLFEELPEKYYDSAFIDRLHTYVPGWEIDVIRGEMFASGYGFVVD
jgi:ATP-dependent Lon protease